MNVKEGDQIVCANGHVVGWVTADLNVGDQPNDWARCFHWSQEDTPIVGSMHIPVCKTCGSVFMRNNEKAGWQMLIRGWRP